MLISKKDLLVITGISYGQLYRWKRERLIPEEWFIKQSSYTGQETFFPREQILSRIQSIQDMKDKYSLDELAKILSPEVESCDLKIADLQELEELPLHMLQIFSNVLEKDNFTYMELLLMIILVRIQKAQSLEDKETGELLYKLRNSISQINKPGLQLVLLQVNGAYHIVVYPDQAEFIFDEQIETIQKVRIDDISSEIKLKYKQMLSGF